MFRTVCKVTKDQKHSPKRTTFDFATESEYSLCRETHWFENASGRCARFSTSGG
jgi:hypothetical protein